MKTYEVAFRTVLPRRMPVILRLDGKAFHTLTAQSERPFDRRVMTAMDSAAEAVCREAQGAVLAYVQSDEISVLLFNYRTLKTEAWFDNGIQKIVSVAASVASVAFTLEFDRIAHFDARAFVVPEAEVCNYFVWRQQDWHRNSLQMLARSRFSQKRLHGKGSAEMHEMLYGVGVNWADLPTDLRRGRCYERVDLTVGDVERHDWRINREIPDFKNDRQYIERRYCVEAPETTKAPARGRGEGGAG